MVSAAEAGPDPIPHEQLSTPSLVHAIRYCLTPKATHAAQDIASKMQQEQGVKAAVASFHRHLPHLTECELLPQFTASWRYKRGKRRYHLSKVAAEILAENHVLVPSKLKLYVQMLFLANLMLIIFTQRHQSCPIHIENKRWDPVTGVSSASLGMAFGILKAGGDIVYKPYEAYKGGGSDSPSSIYSLKNSNSPQLLSPASSSAGESPLSLRKARSMNYLTEANSLQSKEKGKTRAMASASARASGKFLGKLVSGTTVDVPLAAAEGFRVLPGLYGDNVHESERVTDWKSGMLAGAKTFAVGMAESLIDPIYQPYKGARDAGALGFAGGLFKGTFGVVAKMGHGKIFLICYSSIPGVFFQ